MWSWASNAPLERLGTPPIVEVICGVHFDSVPALDPVVVGGFWSTLRGRFPKRQIQPAIAAVPPGLPHLQIQSHVGPLRTWLLSEDEALLIQVQHDRFYLNWRARPRSSYPRFSGNSGLLAQLSSLYEDFSEFCEATVGQPPTARRIELGKVDQLDEGTAWRGDDDLAKMLPALAPLLRFSEGGSAAPALQLRDEKDGATLTLRLDTTRAFAPKPIRGIKLQTVVEMPLDQPKNIEARFKDANVAVNAIFAHLVPQEQRKQRFGAGETSA